MKKGKMKQPTEERAVSEVTKAEQTAVDEFLTVQAAKAFPEVTQAARTALGKVLANQAAKPSVRFEEYKNGTTQKIRIDHADRHKDQTIGEMLLMDALATADRDFAKGIVRQLFDASRLFSQDIDVGTVNLMLSIIKGVEPRDQVETILAAQLAAVHVAAMKWARRAAGAEDEVAGGEDMLQQHSADHAFFNKLIRTSSMLVDALKRYRAGAEHKVMLQHVSVAEGGQAIVGNVTQVPREQRQEKAAVSPPVASHRDERLANANGDKNQ